MTATVLITGAGSGIGLATARAVVARGAQAILWDVSRPALNAARAELGEAARTAVVDVSDAGAVASADLAGVTHLVNNAGILGQKVAWTGLDAEHLKAIFDVNVIGLMLVTQAFAQARMAHPTAAIVNMSSIAGENGGGPGFAAYGASKGAIMALTRAMARDFAPDIRVNALAPGIIDTPIQDTILTAPDARDRVAEGIPMARMGTADEVARAADWLLFDAPYVTGEIIRIAGGRR
ncbi:SDR family NAD(P)-dependent oxidoreductase [Ponticoccus alexandrii]|uniref:SDR family oxidoreductase n=1 Tax=Ponticoccus alexandrii TaxID=1943633 RepID=A0ABX7FFC1_9RHOB|nr:SDR family oxidoreductase [Ponticoccus alexandrii]ETA53428.1 oxidoreductase [Rhodobacteraceae bacterium PD-2]QRF69240.1 SDR family oxidoreductase [Ponticoccus alexandrii]